MLSWVSSTHRDTCAHARTHAHTHTRHAGPVGTTIAFLLSPPIATEYVLPNPSMPTCSMKGTWMPLQLLQLHDDGSRAPRSSGAALHDAVHLICGLLTTGSDGDLYLKSLAQSAPCGRSHGCMEPARPDGLSSSSIHVWARSHHYLGRLLLGGATRTKGRCNPWVRLLHAIACACKRCCFLA